MHLAHTCTCSCTCFRGDICQVAIRHEQIDQNHYHTFFFFFFSFSQRFFPPSEARTPGGVQCSAMTQGTRDDQPPVQPPQPLPPPPNPNPPKKTLPKIQNDAGTRTWRASNRCTRAWRQTSSRTRSTRGRHRCRCGIVRVRASRGFFERPGRVSVAPLLEGGFTTSPAKKVVS